MEQQDIRENVLLNLRSVTQSCKGGVPFDRLQRDYRDLLGSPIPFKDLGYNSLEAFIRDIPHVVSLRKNSEGQLMVEGVADASTAHIVSLVSKQKSETRKRNFWKPSPHIGMRRTLSSRYTFREGSRGSHSHYTSPPHQSSKNLKYKPSKPPVMAQHSKPRVSYEQVPRGKYEVAPRFLKLKEMKNGTSSQELISPANSSSVPFTVTEGIPPPRPAARSLPKKPQLESSRAAQLDALEYARDAKEFVEMYSNINKIIPVYTTVLMGQKAKSRGYVSTLKLGDTSYRTYPDLKPTEAMAEEEVAKKAMVAIKERKEHLNILPETPYSNVEEIRILLNRVEEIVCEKPSGMFANGIIREYEHKFNEKLPTCWTELLKQSCYVEVNELNVQYGKVPEGVNIIVRPIKELSSGNQTPSSTSSKTEYVFEDLDTKSLKKTLVNLSLPKVPEFRTPQGNVWNVYMTYVSGWFSARLLDFHDEFLALSDEMMLFYKTRNFPVKEVFEYQIYAACVDDNPDIWHRVVVEDIKEGQISCYFVDEGDFAYVKQENLQEMNACFLKLPYQAVHLALDDLEEYEKFIRNDIVEKRILGQTLIAEVKRWYSIPDFFPDVSGIHRAVYSVVLFDTSDSSGEDVNLNEWLKKSAIESLICKLPKLLTTSCAYLSHVTPEGLIYLRLTNPQHCLIEQELDKLAPNFEEASTATSNIPLNTMCVAKYESGNWHRVTISDNLYNDPEQVEVFFVDYGHVGVVGKLEVCELAPISEVLASAPHQAICCELSNALPSPKSQWTESATIKLMELAPFDQELIIRVMSEGDDKNLAKVNLYKRNKDSDLITINDSLAHNPTLFREEPASVPIKVPSTLPLQHQISRKSSIKSNLSSFIPDVAMPAEEQQMARRLGTSMSAEQIQWLNTPDNIKSPDAFEVHSPVSLCLPAIPENGKCFDVFVTMAAHPHNFVVQPLTSSAELDIVTKEMQSFYSSDENLLDMHLSMLRKNEYYAALHTDNAWYRVRIEQIIADSPVMVAVHYIDFGDINTVSIDKLQPLYQKFKQLPCQAIKASLAGIKPFDTDWDPVHCIKFQEMVTEKPFVSLIHKKHLQEKDGISSLLLELTLIDTTDTSKDVYIHEILIEKNIAKPL